MDKKKAIYIISMFIVVFVVAIHLAIPKENWSMMPYILMPLGAFALFAVCSITVQYIRPPKEEDDIEEIITEKQENNIEE